jgi:uncharacterized protein YjiS (DUF1127 family)
MNARIDRAETVFLGPFNAASSERRTALAFAGAEDWSARLRQTLFGWVETLRTRAALGALNDRELADIGLTRGDIDRVAEGQPV